MENFYYPEGLLFATSENKEFISSLSGLEYALREGMILEAVATLCDSSHNLYVDLGDYKGIIPKSEAVFCPDDTPIKDIAVITRVGKPVCFKVTDIINEKGTTKIYLSRRLAQKECCEKYISSLRCGDVLDCVVTHMEQFGAFCDIGCGIASLLPVDCISVSRISHPKDRFYPGQKILGVVKNIEKELYRITLSHKELLGTWEENAQLFKPGQTVAGIVRSVEPYGIFVELAPNLAGLAEWCDNVYAGQSAAVYIKSIIPEKMKVKLVIVDTSQNNSTPATKYFLKENHIERWEYSPQECEKKIVTEF